MGEVTESLFVFNRRLNTVVQWASCRKACRGQSDSGAAQVGRIVQPVLRRRIGTSGVLPRDARFCSVLKINRIMQNPFADDKAQWISFVCLLAVISAWTLLGLSISFPSWLGAESGVRLSGCCLSDLSGFTLAQAATFGDPLPPSTVRATHKVTEPDSTRAFKPTSNTGLRKMVFDLS